MQKKYVFLIAVAMLGVSLVVCQFASDKIAPRTEQQIIQGKLTGLEELSLPLKTDTENKIDSVTEKTVPKQPVAQVAEPKPENLTPSISPKTETIPQEISQNTVNTTPAPSKKQENAAPVIAQKPENVPQEPSEKVENTQQSSPEKTENTPQESSPEMATAPAVDSKKTEDSSNIADPNTVAVADNAPAPASTEASNDTEKNVPESRKDSSTSASATPPVISETESITKPEERKNDDKVEEKKETETTNPKNTEQPSEKNTAGDTVTGTLSDNTPNEETTTPKAQPAVQPTAKENITKKAEEKNNSSKKISKDTKKKELAKKSNTGKKASIKFEFAGNTLIFRLTGDGNMVGNRRNFKSPDRIILDVSGIWYIKNVSVPSNALVSKVRNGRHPEKNFTRIVLDLKRPAKSELIRTNKNSLELHIK